ncbi:hypothetical protein BRC65_06185 [Halobacteriales archaeon QH_2_65_14]|nr:MAG: hypothetical protein BRC65_06185 [Halobacteriales archaeon QH_2_65_14]
MDFRNERTLVVGFLLLALAATTVVVLLGGGGVVELGAALAAGAGLAVIVLGSYAISARRGLPHSHAVGVAAVALGVVYALAIVVRLLTVFGA